MRLFIALDLDNKEYFEQIQDLLPEAKAIYPKAFHLTLQFLGETDKLSQITVVLKKIKFNKLKLRTAKIGVFPDEHHPRIIWLGLQDNQDLMQLQKDIESAVEKFKFRKDKKSFHPHITLARIKFLKSNNNYMKELNKIKPEQKEFEIKEFKLIKSELTEQGPVYTDLEVFS